MSWRDVACPIVARVVGRVGRGDPKALRRALRKAYPFGERKYWPYKVWLDEVARQCGRRSPGLSSREYAAQLRLFE
jgi:hypothetical protein